jgi:hypothetical protein
MTDNALPKISVFIFSYNGEKYIGECVESVLDQTLRPFEIIICDDHSLDGSWEIIKEYAGRHPMMIKAYRHESNLGIPKNGNFGMKKVTGDMVSWMDGDDRWLPRKLELEWKALKEHPEAKIAYSNVYLIDAEGNRTEAWDFPNGHTPPAGDVFIRIYSRCFFSKKRLFRNHLIYSSLLSEDHFDLDLESFWDYDEKIRLTAHYPVAYSGAALVERRLHEGCVTKDISVNYRKAHIQVYEKNLPLLAARTQAETVQVRCRVESFFALDQINLPVSEQNPAYSLRGVYGRNLTLLGALPKRERASIQAKTWPLMAKLARLMAEEALDRGDRKNAIMYWLQSVWHDPRSFDTYLTARVLLPRWIISFFSTIKQKVYRSIWHPTLK